MRPIFEGRAKRIIQPFRPFNIDSPEAALRALAFWIILGTLLCKVFLRVRMGVTHQTLYPYDTFLFNGADRHQDFLNVFRPVRTGDPYSSHLFVYFPWTSALLWPLTLLNDHWALWSFLIFTAYGIGKALTREFEALAKEKKGFPAASLIFLAGGFSYPLLFVWDRANLEFWVWGFILLSAVAARRGKKTWSAIALAQAIAMKGSPAVFLLLFLRRRWWREIVVCLGLALALNVGTAALLPGGWSHTGSRLQAYLAAFHQGYAIQGGGMAFNSSPWAILRWALVRNGGWDPERLSKVYLAASVVLLLPVVIFYLRGPKKLWQEWAVPAVLSILLTPISFDYKLAVLWIPTIYFVSECTRAARERGLTLTVFWILVLLMIPKSYAWIEGDIGLGVLLNPVLLLGLLLFALLPLGENRAHTKKRSLTIVKR